MTWTLPAAVVAVLAAPAPPVTPTPTPSEAPAPAPPAAGPAATAPAATPAEPAASAEAIPPAPAPAPHEAEDPAVADPNASTESDDDASVTPPAVIPTAAPVDEERPLAVPAARSSRMPDAPKFDGRGLWIGGAAATGVVFLSQLAAHQLLRTSCDNTADDLATNAATCSGDVAAYAFLRTSGMLAYQVGLGLMGAGGAFTGRARAMRYARGEAEPLDASRRQLGMGLAIGGAVGTVASVAAFGLGLDTCSESGCLYRVDLITTLTLGASVASLGTGAMFWAQSNAYLRKAQELRIAPTASRQGAGLMLGGRF